MKKLVHLESPPGWTGEPLQVLMDAEVHEVPEDVEVPESYIIQTKVHDESGPSEYTAHIYMHRGKIDLLGAFQALLPDTNQEKQ